MQVNEILLAFGSTAHSIAAEQALLNAGVTARVMSLPSQIRAGCGLCLRVAPESLPQADRALENAGIPVESLWRRQAATPGAPSRYTPLE